MVKLTAAYSDEELISGCSENNPRAQERLYAKYYGKMLSVCMRYSRNREDAVELLNTGFLKVFLNIKSYQAKGSFEGWIRRIVVNTVLEEFRKTVNYREVMHFPETMGDGEIKADALEHLYAEDLVQIISCLPPSSRMVFNLFVVEGYSHKEIAEMLKISEGTSKWHVSFAKEKLKKLLEKRAGSKEVKYEYFK
jgi:RNA polymerase sigma-70 factor (ECF subfamily)